MSKVTSAQYRIALAEQNRAKYLDELRNLQEDNRKRLKVLNKIDEFADRVTAKFVQVMTRFDDYIETKKSTVKAEIAEAEAYLDGEVK